MMKKFLVILFVLLVACGGVEEVATPPIAPAGDTPIPATATNLPSTDTPLDPTTPAVEEATEPAPPTAIPTTIVLPTDEPVPAGQPAQTIQLNPVADGFFMPVFITHANDDRLFVIQQHGVVDIVQDGQRLANPFLDLQDRVNSNGFERGLLSLVFHPDYANNGYFFVNYTEWTGNTLVSRFSVTADPNVADPNSELLVMTVGQPYGNHNGGQLHFGPDGYLYIGMGDGGSADDPEGHGQNPRTLLGSMLRIDVDNGDGGVNYAVPADNPFATNGNWLSEIWAIGLRNPWRFSFDRLTGDLFIADVGQNRYEEVSFVPAGSSGDLNFGWNITEGLHCFFSDSCDTSTFVEPIAEVDHASGGHCSITGGYVYRGSQFPTLEGNYFYADYCSGVVWSLFQQAGNEWVSTQVLESGFTVSTFGEDAAGEVYLADHNGGGIYQISTP